NLRSVEPINRPGIADLADNHLVTNPGCCQRLHIGNAQWLALLDPHVSLWRLHAQPLRFLHIHRVTYQAARNRSNGATNKSPSSSVSAGTSDYGTGKCTDAASRQGACARAIRSAIRRLAAGESQSGSC